PRLAARARSLAALGFASACLEAPGAGDRSPLPGMEQARERLRTAIAAGTTPAEDVIDALILPLVDQSVPEWQAALDEFLLLPEIVERVGFSGGVSAIATRPAAVGSRIGASRLFAGSSTPSSPVSAARRIITPLHVLLQTHYEG